MFILKNKIMAIIVLTLLITSLTGLFPINAENSSPVKLPRYREEGTPYNITQSLHPYKLDNPILKDEPNGVSISSPPEYTPTKGVLFWFNYGVWHEVVVDLVVELTSDDAYDEIAYVVVTSVSQQNTATNLFSSAGANMSKVEFFVEPGDSIWIRDYGPHFIWSNNTINIVDSHYYQGRPLDNFIPTLLGDNHFDVQTYDMGLFYSGGNFQPGPNRTGYATELLNVDNPSNQGFNETFIAELFQSYQGIDTLHVLPQLPGSVDGTGHIDMWMYLVDDDTVIISEFQTGSNPTAIAITENAVTYMESLGFEVYRTPAWNANHPDNGYSTHWTYTNALRVNDRIFIPSYGFYSPYSDEDDDALTAFQNAAGSSVDIVQIDCYPIIWAAGAIHCITMQVPKYIDDIPSVDLIYPNGGEIFVNGTLEKIIWEATDTNNNELDYIDLFYSVDGGDNYVHIDTVSDTGIYDWLVPNTFSESVKIKIVATSIDTDQGIATSNDVFKMVPANQTKYDFSSNAGIDKFAWGYQTNSWTSIDGNRKPVNSEIDTLVTGAYVKISASDAMGGDSDSNRYISTNPSYYNEPTHIFEITLNDDISSIDEIKILWEGYADYCTQAEIYIWDYIEGQWGDGEGLFGQNRYMDSWAGNYDGILTKTIRSNLSRYIDVNGKITLLIYAERGPSSYYPNCPSFHDYISLITTEIKPINQAIDAHISSLYENWNLFSLPFNLSINKTQIIIHHEGTNYTWNDAVTSGFVSDFVFGWNRDGQYYTFAEMFEAGYGYWIFAYDDCELWVENIIVEFDDYITDIETDWNIFSIPIDVNLSKDEILVNDVGWSTAVSNGWVNDFIFGWNRAGQYYDFANEFYQGESYWVYASQQCTLKHVV
jgi:agmatine deiminase